MSMSAGLFGELFMDAEMAACLDDAALLQGMLDFEAALARAQDAGRLLPPGAAAAIAACCRAERYDIEALGRAATLAGNPAIPLVKALTAEVAKIDTAAAKWVHFGATSQDVIDSGRARQFAAALGLIAARLARLGHALAALAQAHRATPMIGRTFLQQAVPIVFGFKAALWLDPLLTSRERIAADQPAHQLGGAAGTFASLGAQAAAVQSSFRRAARAPEATLTPWHGQRDCLARLAAELAILTGNCGKIARDVGLMAQTEIGELAEPEAPGKGGSSAMPHKRNPVLCTLILAAAARAPGLAATMLAVLPQEHERALGGWHAEWRTLPELFLIAGTALGQTITLIEGLQVFPDAMRANLELTRGLVLSERVSLALAASVGKEQAHHLLEEASRACLSEGLHLRDVLARMPAVTAHLEPDALAALFDPLTYRGAGNVIIERVLDRHAALADA